jgi:hypothetical protein
MPTPLLALLVLAQTEAPAAPPKLLRVPLFGANVGTYLPTSASVRARFGGNWFSFSPGLGMVLPPPMPRLMPDFSLATKKRTIGAFNNRAFLALLGAQYQIPLFKLTPVEGQALRLPLLLPYAGASVGAVYANLRSGADGINGSGFAPTGSVYIGTSVGLNGFFEARWRGMGRVRGFNLSGLDLGAGIRF